MARAYTNVPGLELEFELLPRIGDRIRFRQGLVSREMLVQKVIHCTYKSAIDDMIATVTSFIIDLVEV